MNLREVLEAASKEVASWPPEKQAYYRQWAAKIDEPDACKCKDACTIHQTCVGGCVYEQ